MIKKTVLESGTTIISEEIPEFRSVSLGYFTRNGARGDPSDLQGLSHFLEHLLFKGTKNRSARDIANSLEDRGGSLDALTAKEFMSVYAKVLDEDMEIAMDVIGDLVSNPLFPEEEVEKEKGVILEEYRASIDSPEDRTLHNLLSSLFPDHPLSWEVLGNPETINKISKENILNHWKKIMSSQSSFLVAAGRVSHEQLISHFLKYFSFPGDSPPPKWDPPPREVKSNISIQVMERLKQAYIALGTRIPKYEDSLRYAFVLTHAVLGSGMGSRLFYQLREKEGLVYSISSFLDFFSDSGIFGVYFALEPVNIERALNSVKEQLHLLYENGITENELKRAKQRVRGNLALNQESSFSRMSRLASIERYVGKIVPIDEVMMKYSTVSLSEIERGIRSYLNPDSFSISIVGPKGVEKWKVD